MRLFKILVLFLISGTAFGQSGAAMMMTSAAVGDTYLLDDYPADAAYSLRLLKADHIDSAAIRVRRSSDNSELDIGFTAQGYLDTASMKTFVGVNSGYVVTWYDQSGNERDATQSTASNQPLIISSGTIFRRNSLPAVDFGTTTNAYHLVLTTDGFASSRLDMFSVLAIDNHDGSGSIYFGTSSGNLWWQHGTISGNTTNHYTQGSGVINSVAINDGTVRLLNDYADASNVNVDINTTNYTRSETVSTVGTGSLTYNIGKWPGGTSWDLDGTIQEMIIYTSIQTSNRVAISSNINTHYSIY